MRIVLVLIILLVLIVLRLPFALKGDETLSGRLQTFLAYALGALGVMLSLATVFLSCSTLTGELRSRSLHLVVTKPVSRFEILAGKWLGVVILNVMLLVLGGVVIYAFATFIRNRPEQFPRDRIKLDETIWTARLAATPKVPDFRKLAEETIEARIKQGAPLPSGRDATLAQIEREITEAWRRVAPGEYRVYEFVDLPPPTGKVFQVRFRARGVPVPPREMLPIRWAIIDPESGSVLDERLSSERSGDVHQFLVHVGAVRNGRAALGVLNPIDPQAPSRSTIYFEGDDALQLLYRVGSFEANLVNTLLMTLFRLAFLSALSLFFSTFVSFPVACFCVLSIYAFCLGMPWWLESIGANRQLVDPASDPYGALGPVIRLFMVPVLRYGLPDFSHYDGVARLVEGFAVTGASLARAALHTILYGLALLAVPGWLIFRSREIAEVQVN